MKIKKTAYLKPFSSLDVNIHCYRREVARCVFVRTILQIGFQRPSCLSCRKGWKNSELIFFFFLNIRFWIFYSTIFLSKSSKYFQEWKFKNSFPIISVFNHILFAINYKVRSKSRTKIFTFKNLHLKFSTVYFKSKSATIQITQTAKNSTAVHSIS